MDAGVQRVRPPEGHMFDALLKILEAVAISGLTSLITVYLSRNKFRSERMWERKAAALRKDH